LQRVHNFAPKKSFLELHKLAAIPETESDPFLTAIDKIRKEQQAKEKDERRREVLRSKNASRWKEILNQKEIEEF
jgi:hypothetical protein